MRWENIWAQLNSGCQNTGAVIEQQRNAIQNVVNSLQGSDEEAEKIQKSLLLQKQLQGLRTTTGAHEESVIERFMKELEEAIGKDITDSLDLNQEDKDAARRAISEEKFKNIKAIKNRYGLSDQRKTIQRHEYEKLLHNLEVAAANSQGLDNSVTRKLNEIITSLRAPKFFAKEGKASIWKKAGGGHSITFKDQEEAALELSELMNLGSALITIGSVAQDIGKIGEYFGAAAVAIAYAKEDESIDKVLSDLVKNGKGSGSGMTIEIVGEQKSAKGFYSDDPSNFVQGVQQSGSEGEYFYHFHPTDDKVDFVLTTTDNPSGITFSMKNYADTSSVTILSGNIFPILANYNNFIEHYIALLISSGSTNRSGQISEMYQAVKFTVGVHGLVGGVKALNDLGAVITTPTASYFIVNNNRRTDDQSLRVYNTKTLGQAIINQANLIELLGGDRINEPYDPRKSDYDSRFSNINVELKLRELRKSISK